MSPRKADKVVLRFKDGRLIKGYLLKLSDDSRTVSIERGGGKGKDKAFSYEKVEVPADELKAIFFVKSFKGDKGYKERKSYGIQPKRKGKKVYVRFTDGESLLGYIEDDLPWEKGFYLSKPPRDKIGFFVLPVDTQGNNIKIYVLNSAIRDITLVG